MLGEDASCVTLGLVLDERPDALPEAALAQGFHVDALGPVLVIGSEVFRWVMHLG